MVRIIAGEAKGRKIKTEAGSDLRPTLGRVKSSMFSVIGERVVESRVLDLFAGSGNLGLEALSRGAKQAAFIESNQRRCRLIRENLEHLGLAGRGLVVRSDVLRFLDRNRSLECDLILADPPYTGGWIERLVRRLAGNSILAPGGLVCLQHGPGETLPSLPPGLYRFRQKCYGDTVVTFLLRERDLE